MQRLKRLHLAHHFHNEQGNFGITNFLWDRLFGTFYGKAKLSAAAPPCLTSATPRRWSRSIPGSRISPAAFAATAARRPPATIAPWAGNRPPMRRGSGRVMNIVTAAPAAASIGASSIRVEPVRMRRRCASSSACPASSIADMPGYVAPLELERLDALRQDKNPFFQHAERRVLARLREAAGPSAASAPRSTGSRWSAMAPISAISACRRRGRSRRVRALLDAAEAWLQGAGLRRDARSVQPVINEEIRPAGRRLRRAADADDALPSALCRPAHLRRSASPRPRT